MIECRNLELHVAHGCNLACESCSHYSNHAHRGMLTLTEARRLLATWGKRLRPRQCSLLGGEPTLNPALTQLVWLSRDSFPDSNMILVTNGFLLGRHPRLPVALWRTGAVLHVSVHHESEEYEEKLQPVRKLVADWQRRWEITVVWRSSSSRWERRFHGYGGEMRPYDDGDSASSWRNCRSRWCLQLHEGKLWKCPAIAYLGMQQRKYGLSPDWDRYLDYKPLAPDCSDAELNEFVNRQTEPICGMCPAQPERFDLPNPLRRRSREERGNHIPVATR